MCRDRNQSKDGFVDIHHHLVYGMDDGPESLQEARAMIEGAKEDGIKKIVVTPHVVPGIEYFDHRLYAERLGGLKEYARAEGIELLPGAEVFFTDAARRHLDDGRVPTLADTRFVLVEFSPDIAYEKMVGASESLLIGGYIPIFAHIERYECLVSRPKRAAELKEALNVQYQINCSTVIKGKGFTVNRFCRNLFEEGLVDAVATDAHNISTRPVRMTAAYQALEKQCGVAYAERLTGVRGGLLT